MWAVSVRYRYERGELTPDQIERLNAFPGWSWRLKPQPGWDFWYDLLKRRAHEHGRSLEGLPHKVKIEGYHLGEWVSLQRADYGRNNLSAERIERLESLPGWIWNKHARRWDEMFTLLQRYAEREGHAVPPVAHVEDGEPLGNWVRTNTNQAAYRGKLGKRITADRIAKLESLPGWGWQRHESAWNRQYASLLAFVKREGHARVPQGFMEGEVALGSWVGRQRAFHRQRMLSQDCVARLEAVQGWQWNPPIGGSKRRRGPHAPDDAGPHTDQTRA